MGNNLYRSNSMWVVGFVIVGLLLLTPLPITAQDRAMPIPVLRKSVV